MQEIDVKNPQITIGRNFPNQNYRLYSTNWQIISGKGFIVHPVSQEDAALEDRFIQSLTESDRDGYSSPYNKTFHDSLRAIVEVIVFHVRPNEVSAECRGSPPDWEAIEGRIVTAIKATATPELRQMVSVN